MAENPDMEARAAEVKQQLEAVAGHAIDGTPDQLLKAWYPAGAVLYPRGGPADPDPSYVLSRNILSPGSFCTQNGLLDASGASTTGSDGRRAFRLSEFACYLSGYRLLDPVNFVATPRASTPSFVTFTSTLITQGENFDVSITVFTWNADGAAAPNVDFDWRCRVVAQQKIF
jgi:hypothetical protein